MNEPTIRVSVSCPICTEEHIYALSTATAAAALLNGDDLRLMCGCQAQWVATDIERAQMREYLGALSIR